MNQGALLSALLFGVAFPPFPPVLAALLCLVPVSVAVARLADANEPWRAAARTGFWFGALGYALNISWIASALSIYTRLAIPAFLTTVATLGAIVGLFMALLWRFRRSTRLPLFVLLPIVWVTLEVVLERLPQLAFPWLPLGLATAGSLPAAQLADVSGVHGVSAILALVNGLLADAWMARARLTSWAPRAALAASVVAAMFAVGAARARAIATRELAPITIVQPNIAQRDKWTPAHRDSIAAHLADLSRRAAAAARAELIVWPESALPGTLASHPGWSDTVRALASSLGAPIIFGTVDSAPPRSGGRWYNAAMIAEPEPNLGVQPPYHKAYLVPVIERVPFANVRAVFGVPYFGGYASGGAARPFSLPFGRVGMLICFESTFGERARAQRRAGADVLVAITNDAWFGWSNAPEQHLAHLVLRAIETRMPIVRAANTGISAYVTPVGELGDETERFVSTTATYHVRTAAGPTLYVRMGDWVGLLCAFLAGALLVRPILRIRRA